MYLPLMKALWCGETSLFAMFPNLRVMTLEKKFKAAITETNGPELLHVPSIRFLWDEGEKSKIKSR